MSGFSNPVTNALGVLVRTVLKSINYIAGISGWAIFKDGSAEFNNGIFRGTLTLGPPGPGTTRIELGSTMPPPLNTYLFGGSTLASDGIIFWSGTPSNDDYQFIVNVQFPGEHAIYWGAVLNGAVIESVAGHPDGLRETFDGGGTRHNNFTGILTPDPGAPVQSYFLALDISGGATDPLAIFDYLNTSDPTASGTVEQWHAMTLQNAWVNFGGGFITAQYRMIASPPRSVEVIGTISGGTATPGTVIATLPAGNYTPINIQRNVIYAFGAALNIVGETPAMDIATNGNLSIKATTNATILTFHFTIALDA